MTFARGGSGAGALHFQDWFSIGMKRTIPELVKPGPRQLTIGGSEVTDDKLYRPHWNLAYGLLDFHSTKPGMGPIHPRIEDASIDTIWSNHFFEHLNGEYAIFILREVERVLKVGGTANIVVPYYSSQMQAQDLDHKSVWTERTWATLFENNYYDDHGKWSLRVHACFICGIVERNLALFTQLMKDA